MCSNTYQDVLNGDCHTYTISSGDESTLVASYRADSSGRNDILISRNCESLLNASGDHSIILNTGEQGILKATGDASIIINTSRDAKFKTGTNGTIISNYTKDGKKRFVVGYIGEDLKPNTWYEVNDMGKFQECISQNH